MIRRLLIANRGEIAIRIARTAREMGIACVGVYSEADRDALHRKAMDETIEIGGPLPAESYLNIRNVLKAARRSRVDGVHPGYGFLSENAEFAKRCEEAGLIFIGPGPKAMALTGDKIASRKAMRSAGVPVTPGMDRVVRSPDEAAEIAERLGYPVMFKATAGGGGIGMSRVDRPRDLPSAFESAQSVARANFGNPDLFLEKYIEHARHVEVQVLIGRRSNGLHFGERECSVQRRHQKLVEETPAVCLTPSQRRRLCETAVKGFLRVGYRNAGTAEFLYHEGKLTFNEINARLQVEHPITEMVTLVDLVRQQILVASGLDPEVSQNEVHSHGHAMECRVNAEDPLRNFLPSPGRVVGYREPAGHAVRVDSGVASGSIVPPFYDSLLAKLIVRGRSRAEVVGRMGRAVADFEVLGVKTNLPFHAALLREPDFTKGNLWTTMIADLQIVERMRGRGLREERIAAIAAAIAAGPGAEALGRSLPLQRPAVSAWSLAGRNELHGGADAVPHHRRR